MRIWILVMAALSAGGCRERSEEQTSVPPPVQFQFASVNLVQHGERLSRILGCIGCHGDDLTGEDWSEPGFGRLWTANLTRSAEQFSDQQLEAMIRTGARRDGSAMWEMPAHLFTHLTDDDMAALLAFVRSKPPSGDQHPLPELEEGARRAIAAGNFRSSVEHVRREGRQWPPDAGDQNELGRYIVRATCAECHQMNLAGGQPHPAAAPRPDLHVIVPAYDRVAFTRLLRDGKGIGDRELELMSDVARSRYRHLSDSELSAIYDYLQAVTKEIE